MKIFIIFVLSLTIALISCKRECNNPNNSREESRITIGEHKFNAIIQKTKNRLYAHAPELTYEIEISYCDNNNGNACYLATAIPVFDNGAYRPGTVVFIEFDFHLNIIEFLCSGE